MKQALLISACLLGTNCKYNGGNNALPEDKLSALREHYRLVPVCPERDGGLPTPRLPSERRGERVVNTAGEDVTGAFRRGAALALETALREDCRIALLKERSPSCGSGIMRRSARATPSRPSWPSLVCGDPASTGSRDTISILPRICT